jgi:hypothetical protein
LTIDLIANGEVESLTKSFTKLGMGKTKIENLIQKEQPNLVYLHNFADLGKVKIEKMRFIYIMTPYFNKAHRTIELLKNRFPGVPIIAGGPHPTVDADNILNKLQ